MQINCGASKAPVKRGCELMQVGKQEFAWTCMIARSNENESCMRVDESWPEINQKNAQKLCWACCYKVETASRSKLVNNSHATLMTGQTSKNSRWLACACIKIWDSSKLMRVDASWCELAVKRKRDLQLASACITCILVWPGLKTLWCLRTIQSVRQTQGLRVCFQLCDCEKDWFIVVPCLCYDH